MIGKAGEKKLCRAARRVVAASLGLCFFFIPSAPFAVPVEVTLYPDSARITETVRVKLPSPAGSLASANFTLPGSADPATLTIGCLPAGSCRVEDYQVKRIDTPLGLKEAEIEKKAAKLRDEDARIRAAILATEAQIQFWQLQTKAKTKTLADARNMAAAIGQNIRKAGQEKIALEDSLRRAEQRLREVEAERAALPDRRKSTWQVTVSLYGTTAREQTLGFTYRMSGCVWSPAYRVEARPGEGKILLTFDAEIRQSSGQDWKDVQVVLASPGPPRERATASAASSPSPDTPAAPPAKKGKKSRKASAVKKTATPPLENEMPSTPAIAPIAAAAYGPWSLGKIDVPAGATVRRNVIRETGDASFLYLLEPGAEKPVLQSNGRHSWTAGMPEGPAMFLIDGSVTGRGRFSAETVNSLPLGADPRVSLRVKSGSARSEVVNGRPGPIRLHWKDGRPSTDVVSIPSGAALTMPPSPAPSGFPEKDASTTAPAKEERK